MNQLLRLPLLKDTHTHTHTQNKQHTLKKKKKVKKNKQIKRKSALSSLPKKNEDPCNAPDRGPYSNSQGIVAVNCCRKDIHPRGCRYPRFSSFLCKCNLTKC